MNIGSGVLNNCPKGSKLIYSDGLKIANDKYKKGDKEVAGKLIDDIYAQRIKHFPSNLGKVYSDWAMFFRKKRCIKRKSF